MKKNFKEPTISIANIENNDVIVTSWYYGGEIPGYENDNANWNPLLGEED